MKPTFVKPALYAWYYFELKELAASFGYNLLLHGSMNRDLDLVLIPWHQDLGDIDELIKTMAEIYEMAQLPKEKKIEVIKYVTSQKMIKTSDLQRKFLWGYYRAGHTMDWLNSLGIISSFSGLAFRNVLMSNQDAINKYLKQDESICS